MTGRLTIVALVFLARSAWAFPVGNQFDIDPVTGDGAGGVAFTGAPRWAGHTCDVCHTDPPRRIRAALLADPVDLFAGYQPSATYQLRVVLQDEWAGLEYASAGDNCGPQLVPYQACDDNGFAIEIDDESGVPAGSLAPTSDAGDCNGPVSTDPDVYVLSDGTAAMHSGFHSAVSQWNFCWTAPASGTGAVVAFVAVVDGNGGDGTAANPNDTLGDDVFAGAVPIVELGGTLPAPDVGGCAVVAGGHATDTLAILALLLVVGVVSWRRRRWLSFLILFSLVGGCATTKPWQKEKLAKRKMKFGADPAEDELDLHMQEAREGAQGGFGSAGGGCGCN